MLDILYTLSTAFMMVLALQAASALLGRRTLLERRIPWVAIGLTAVAVTGVAVQLSWPDAYAVLANVPGRSGWWRPATAIFLQVGAFGSAYNLITIAIVAALAEWYWGRWTALALFAFGMVGPHLISSVLIHGSQAHGLHADPRNFVGSSGATYVLNATMSGALVMSRLLGRSGASHDVMPALGLVVTGALSWELLGNAHGVVSLYGAAVGALLALILRPGGEPDQDRRTVLALVPVRWRAALRRRWGGTGPAALTGPHELTA
jgi:hypothetical protein